MERKKLVWMIGICSHLLPMAGWSQIELFKLTLEDLSQIKVENHIATLTTSSEREVPANVTIITHEDIVASGARSLDELLEIYVPSFTYMYKVHGSQMGIRGIISDRNNKILLLVNGRNMNVKATDGGAITERWTSTLDDIRRITVVNGPGSAVFGPGAIAGVINIETFDAFSFKGTETDLKAATGEKLLSAQIRHGRMLDDRWGLFLFYGIDQAGGADDSHAPHKVAFDRSVERPQYGTTTVFKANEDFPFETTPDGASFLSHPRHVFHLQLDSDDITLWTRFTQTGQAVPTLQNFYFFHYNEYGENYTKIFENTGNRQKQWTLFGKYTQRISSSLTVDYSASYMRSDLENVTLSENISGKKWAEKDGIVDIIARYTPFDNHSLAFGASYDYTEFSGHDALYTTQISTVLEENPLAYHPNWSSYLVSFYGEYQGKINDEMTLFVGGRADKHRFSRWMFSPRLALIYMPDVDETFKLVYNHSVRHSDDADLYSIYLTRGEKGDVEKIDHIEGIYSRSFDEKHRIDLSLYYDRHEAVSFVQHTMKQEYIGTLDFYGIEALYRYETPSLAFRFSHSYTKQLDFELDDPSITYQNISASPYGYGNDLANWHTHMTKFFLEYKPTEKFSWNTSLRVFWGMPGAVDLADYNREKLGASTLLPIYSDGKRAFGTSAFLDVGVRYRVSEETELSLYGYDLLGLFDDDLNKRNFFQRTSHYRDTAPAVLVGFRYRF